MRVACGASLAEWGACVSHDQTTCSRSHTGLWTAVPVSVSRAWPDGGFPVRGSRRCASSGQGPWASGRMLRRPHPAPGRPRVIRRNRASSRRVRRGQAHCLQLLGLCSGHRGQNGTDSGQGILEHFGALGVSRVLLPGQAPAALLGDLRAPGAPVDPDVLVPGPPDPPVQVHQRVFVEFAHAVVFRLTEEIPLHSSERVGQGCIAVPSVLPAWASPTLRRGSHSAERLPRRSLAAARLVQLTIVD